MTEHVLKTLPDYWHAVARGDKNFEVRRDDRGFQKGDVLCLCRLRKSEPDGRWVVDFGGQHQLRRKVTYVLKGGQFGVEPGYVVLGLKKA